MILIDSRIGSKDLLPMILRFKVEAQLTQLEAGDICFYGNTPDGEVLVGIERKRMDSSDMLASIHSGRYAGFQQLAMTQMYPIRILLVEGLWKAGDQGELLVRDWRGWREVSSKGRPTMYSMLFNWLMSCYFTAGTFWMQTSSPFETAMRAVCLYQWFSKPWDQHNSQSAIHQQAFAQFTPPSFEQRVAAQIDGVGQKRSLAAAKYFKNMPNMVKADEQDWMRGIRVGAPTARKIVSQVQGGGSLWTPE